MIRFGDIPTPRLKRAHVVWSALFGAMSVVGGFLAFTGTSHGGATTGWALPEMNALGVDSLDGVLLTREPLARDRWRAIVIHHSGSQDDTPATIERRQMRVSPGLRGLGYHFVIGNGVRMGNGSIELGFRWLDQLEGAHVTGADADWYNRNAIGVCLVGDGNRSEFGDRQLARLTELVRLLMVVFDIPADRVYTHDQLADVPSPGSEFDLEAFRRTIDLPRN